MAGLKACPTGVTVMNDAVIVSAVRTAVGKAPADAARRPDDLAGAVIADVLGAPGLDPPDRRRSRLRSGGEQA